MDPEVPAALLYLSSLRSESERARQLVTSLPGGVDALAMGTVSEILETVQHTPGCVALLPAEDSFQGEHTPVLDQLVFDTAGVLVSEEVVVSVVYGAYRAPGDDASDWRIAVAPPRAVEHSHRFVRQHGLATRFVGSSTEACAVVAGGGGDGLVALAPADVAEAHSLVPVARSMDADVPDARTRFVVLGHRVGARSGHDKTSLVLSQAADRSGNLERFLRAFAEAGVNLVSLHSRPLVESAGSYCFLATAEAHVTDPAMQRAVAALWDAGAEIKLLGSYPAWGGDDVVAPFRRSPQSSVGPADGDAARARVLAPPGPNVTEAADPVAEGTR